MTNKLFLTTTDDLKLACRFYPCENSKALIIVVHGLGEYQDRYIHLAKAFTKSNFSCLTCDIRGHGYSDGPRGYTPSYEQLLDDLNVILDHALSLSSGVPLYLYGHSMGGNIVANFILRRKKPEVKAAIISSPWFSLSVSPSIFEIALGKLISKFKPDFVRNSNLNPHILSHDKNAVADYIEDPMVHGIISPKLFFGCRNAGKWALKNAAAVKIPLLVMQSEEDHLVSPAKSKEFAEKAGADFKLWKGMYHEPHNEINKNEVLDFVISWYNSLN